MNKITRYITTGAAALLMLMSVGAIQNNVNASKKRYRNHVTRRVEVRYHHSRKSRRNHRVAKHEVNRLKRRVKKNRRIRRNRRRKQVVLKPRYQIVRDNRRGNQALAKSGFVDGNILTKMGLGNSSNYIFNKYAPNDKRAKLPNYMNPRANKQIRRSASYNNVNKDLWVKGIFNLKDPKENTRNPQVYKYYPKAHGWELAPRY